MSEGDAQIQGKLGSVSEAEVEDAGASAEFKAQVLSEKPSWAGCSSGSAQLLNSWHGTVLNAESTDTLKNLFKSNNPGMLKACREALSSIKDGHALQCVFMQIFAGCRSDSSLNEVLRDSAKSVMPTL